jgi:hypothetical protein
MTGRLRFGRTSGELVLRRCVRVLDGDIGIEVSDLWGLKNLYYVPDGGGIRRGVDFVSVGAGC